MIFHWEFYLNKYPDLRKNGLKSPEDAYQHWMNFGKKELRIYIDTPIIFDWKNYLLNNKDHFRKIHRPQVMGKVEYIGSISHTIFLHISRVVQLFCTNLRRKSWTLANGNI